MMNQKGKIEVLLSKLREEMVALSLRDDQLSDNESHLIHTVDNEMPDIRNHLRMIYLDHEIVLEEAQSFHKRMKDTLEKAFHVARLDEVLEREENDLLNHVHNTFVQILRLVKSDMRRVDG